MPKNTIFLKNLTTPIGDVCVGILEGEMCLLEFLGTQILKDLLDSGEKVFRSSFVYGEDILFDEIQGQLDEYFLGKRKDFSIPIRLFGTEFQKKAWNELCNIPYGEVRSYKEQAKNIGKPTAFRAVANANGANKISIVVPCHRIIASGGGIGGYSGELWRKKALLQIEGH